MKKMDNITASVNLQSDRALLGVDWFLKPRTGHNLILNFTERKNMRKLISILVAAVFALSSGFALAASHTGAQPMEKKDEMKKGDKKKEKKKSSKKSTKKAEPKKDEMKK
jgi:mannitol-specific phosphotransferase system IIBC component